MAPRGSPHNENRTWRNYYIVEFARYRLLGLILVGTISLLRPADTTPNIRSDQSYEYARAPIAIEQRMSSNAASTLLVLGQKYLPPENPSVENISWSLLLSLPRGRLCSKNIDPQYPALGGYDDSKPETINARRDCQASRALFLPA